MVVARSSVVVKSVEVRSGIGGEGDDVVGPGCCARICLDPIYRTASSTPCCSDIVDKISGNITGGGGTIIIYSRNVSREIITQVAFSFL